MTAEAENTLKSVVLYLIKNLDEGKKSVYYVVKAAYYAQQRHLAVYGLPLFEDSICAMKFGPVPSRVYNALRVARGETDLLSYSSGKEVKKIASAIGFEQESFFAKEDPDMDWLSVSAKECLDYAVKTVKRMSVGKIIHDTHGEEWTRAFNSEDPRHKMDDIAIAREAGADEAIISYLKNSQELDTILS